MNSILGNSNNSFNPRNALPFPLPSPREQNELEPGTTNISLEIDNEEPGSNPPNLQNQQRRVSAVYAEAAKPIPHSNNVEAVPISRFRDKWVINLKIRSGRGTLIDNKIDFILKVVFANRNKDYERMRKINAMLTPEEANLLDNDVHLLPFCARVRAPNTPAMPPPQSPPNKHSVQKRLDAAHDRRDSLNKPFLDASHNGFHLNIQQIQSLEVLAHHYAYNVNKYPGNIEVPILFNDQMVKVDYQVERIPIAFGYEAYGLKPLPISPDSPKYPPILLFPGTSKNPWVKGANARYMANLDLTGPGFIFFKMASGRIRDWLQLNTQPDVKALVTGHSLGGAFTAYTSTYFKDSTQGVTFNAPAISPIAARKYHALDRQGMKPQLINIVNQSDKIIPHLGYKRIGEDVVVDIDVSANMPNSEKIKRSGFWANHSLTALDNDFLMIKKKVKTMMPGWAQLAFQITLLVLSCFFWIPLLLFWAIFGHEDSNGEGYLLAPVERFWKNQIKPTFEKAPSFEEAAAC